MFTISIVLNISVYSVPKQMHLFRDTLNNKQPNKRKKVIAGFPMQVHIYTSNVKDT